MKQSQQKYLESLDKRLETIDSQINQRKSQQQKANLIFIEHVQKQLEMLSGQESAVRERNETFLEQVRNYRGSFDKFVPEVMEIDQKIRQAKQKFIIKCMDHESA